ncbi:hypothetical protein AGMMS49975_01310 [Clostridia bacterium]|nr:hypothetical protein AGMMS49975_01310 [Clostridia bacterium]
MPYDEVDERLKPSFLVSFRLRSSVGRDFYARVVRVFFTHKKITAPHPMNSGYLST